MPWYFFETKLNKTISSGVLHPPVLLVYTIVHKIKHKFWGVDWAGLTTWAMHWTSLCVFHACSLAYSKCVCMNEHTVMVAEMDSTNKQTLLLVICIIKHPLNLIKLYTINL